MQNNRFFGAVLAFCAIFLWQSTYAQNAVFQQRIEQIATSVRAEVGVGILNVANGETYFVNKTKHLPMQSVFKLHLALAVLDQVDKGKLRLDQKIFVTESDMKTDLYSPLRDKYPKGNLNVSLRDLVRYSVSESDNVACDLLFGLLGGPEKVQQYLQQMGIKEVSVANIEVQIQKDWETQFANWTTPQAMLQLLKKVNERKLFSKSSHDFLWDIMTTGPTGANRIKSLLPKGTVVAHKTGTSGSQNGVMGAVNDAGIVVLPNGKRIAIVVFVANSKGDIKANEAVIAQISKATWDYFGGK
ncbi:MAG: class A beta-lactamase, subclass A2 [Runella slithyformis]|nr:MAG: class A beta-lactamase, subclass A2 [Runella slithyformis]TAF47048.1 MAG: class A beta-lactamase, subclass A2 [Runella slithyformis]TAF82009.1 MAG: class A beta-lactamase, subclass A2 [Runella slithyformis]